MEIEEAQLFEEEEEEERGGGVGGGGGEEEEEGPPRLQLLGKSWAQNGNFLKSLKIIDDSH